VGTTFEIYLPQTPERASKFESESDTKTETKRGSETVLVAEDDEGVRELACQFLKVHGYQVIEAKDGADAIEVAARYAGEIHLLLSDMVMPRMNGKELAQRLKAARPGIRVAFMTGYSEYAAPDSARSAENHPILQKPFSVGSITELVRDALAGPASDETTTPPAIRVS
jgi:two-component system, cell cycle sensor histidine kinase and response regulator CckA